VDALTAVLDQLTQTEPYGGMHTAPELRLLLLLLARLHRAKDIIETGYDAGYTTLALSWSEAEVLAVDNLSEYPEADHVAKALLSARNNVTCVNENALMALFNRPDESVDLIFIDDNHRPVHVRTECHEVRRILRPGGIAVFHDTTVGQLQEVVEEMFDDWHKIFFSAFSPGADYDCGFGIVRKP
jgi:predicted O-methyltransferase YrrM